MGIWLLNFLLLRNESCQQNPKLVHVTVISELCHYRAVITHSDYSRRKLWLSSLQLGGGGGGGGRDQLLGEIQKNSRWWTYFTTSNKSGTTQVGAAIKCRNIHGLICLDFLDKKCYSHVFTWYKIVALHRKVRQGVLSYSIYCLKKLLDQRFLLFV